MLSIFDSYEVMAVSFPMFLIYLLMAVVFTIWIKYSDG